MAETPATREQPWPVATVSKKIGDWVARLGAVWIEGEITQWSVSGGNVYGKIKDLSDPATLSFTVWSSVRGKLPANLKQGDRVALLGKPNFWAKGGTLTLQALDIRHVGIGDLLERLERLRAQLASEGLFDRDRKQALPFLPGGIGLITGKDSDAEKDVLRNATLRWPGVVFHVRHAAVQGDRVPGEVVAAIQALDADPRVEVIIIARGGGDFQNLLGFSDERVVRAAAAAATPIVSAIGHEADRPLLDEVADLRASTPTDAAKRVVPDVGEELAMIAQGRARLATRVAQLLRHETERIGSLRARPVLAEPERLVELHSQDLTRWVARGAELALRQVETAAQHTQELRTRLRALSPSATLDRGYAIAQTADGRVLRDPAEAPAGAGLRLTLAEGVLGATSAGSPAAN